MAALGQPELAALLFGAAQAFLECIGAPLAPSDQAEIKQDRQAVREILGEGAFQAAWDEGQALSLEQTIELTKVWTVGYSTDQQKLPELP